MGMSAFYAGADDAEAVRNIHRAPTCARRSSIRPRTTSFQLVSARYERASLIVTSNKPFGRPPRQPKAKQANRWRGQDSDAGGGG
jgi:hypothetical protein